MNTLSLTDAELEIVVKAVELVCDMETDTTFEDLTTDLYPRGDNVSVLTEADAGTLRDELLTLHKRALVRQRLAAKLGINLNEDGYVAS